MRQDKHDLMPGEAICPECECIYHIATGCCGIPPIGGCAMDTVIGMLYGFEYTSTQVKAVMALLASEDIVTDEAHELRELLRLEPVVITVWDNLSRDELHKHTLDGVDGFIEQVALLLGFELDFVYKYSMWTKWLGRRLMGRIV